MFVEVLLQPLIGQVDQQLLERVGGERFEAVDVQHADVAAHDVASHLAKGIVV